MILLLTIFKAPNIISKFDAVELKYSIITQSRKTNTKSSYNIVEIRKIVDFVLKCKSFLSAEINSKIKWIKIILKLPSYSIPLSTRSTTISAIFCRHKSFGGKFNSGAPVASSDLFWNKSGASSDAHVLIGSISIARPRANFP